MGPRLMTSLLFWDLLTDDILDYMAAVCDVQIVACLRRLEWRCASNDRMKVRILLHLPILLHPILLHLPILLVHPNRFFLLGDLPMPFTPTVCLTNKRPPGAALRLPMSHGTTVSPPFRYHSRT